MKQASDNLGSFFVHNLSSRIVSGADFKSCANPSPSIQLLPRLRETHVHDLRSFAPLITFPNMARSSAWQILLQMDQNGAGMAHGPWAEAPGLRLIRMECCWTRSWSHWNRCRSLVCNENMMTTIYCRAWGYGSQLFLVEKTDKITCKILQNLAELLGFLLFGCFL